LPAYYLGIAQKIAQFLTYVALQKVLAFGFSFGKAPVFFR